MSPIICNKCYKNICGYFSLLNCYHSFCDNCIKKIENKCFFCKKEVEIDFPKILSTSENISLIGLNTDFILRLLNEYFHFKKTQQNFNLKIRNRKIIKIETLLQKLLFYIEKREYDYREKEELLINNIQLKENILREQFKEEWDEFDDPTLIK